MFQAASTHIYGGWSIFMKECTPDVTFAPIRNPYICLSAYFNQNGKGYSLVRNIQKMYNMTLPGHSYHWCVKSHFVSHDLFIYNLNWIGMISKIVVRKFDRN